MDFVVGRPVSGIATLDPAAQAFEYLRDEAGLLLRFPSEKAAFSFVRAAVSDTEIRATGIVVKNILDVDV